MSDHLLLLPGMMCDARMWQSQQHDLDIPTSVASMVGADSMAGIAANILANAPQRFALAGLSMGGILAFEIWRQAPERVTHLALLDTNPHADTPERKSLRIEQIETVLNGGLRKLAVDSLKPLYLAESNRDDETLLETILDMAVDLGPDVFRQQSIALHDRIDSSETLRTINVPTTVICGAEDTLCPVAFHEYMAAEIPDAKLVVIDNCGHLASMEQPAVVTAELRSLLARQAKPEQRYAT